MYDFNENSIINLIAQVREINVSKSEISYLNSLFSEKLISFLKKRFLIEDDMIIGVGTGSTVNFFIQEKYSILCLYLVTVISPP